MRKSTGKSSRSVLLVDDEELITDFIGARLRASGFGVTVSRNGLEALEAIAGEQPDLVITDVRMPFMGGIELSRVLASDPATAAIPVLLLTAAPGDFKSESAPNIRATVRKPFAVEEIVTRSIRLLERRPG